MVILGQSVKAQADRVPASTGREEFIEVEKNVKLHVTDLGDGQPVILIHGWDLRPALAKIKIPAAIFQGMHDKLCEYALAEQLQKGIKNSYIVKFENSGHALFFEEREKFNTEQEKFAKKRVI